MLKIILFTTVALLAFTAKYRILGVMYIQLWEFTLIFCLLFWGFDIAYRKRIDVPTDSLNWAIAIFLMINILSSLRMSEHAGKYMEGGMWHNLRSFEPILLYLMVRDYLTSRNGLRSFIYFMLGVLSIEVMIGLVQSLGNITWPQLPGETSLENNRSYLYYLLGIGSPLVNPAYGTFFHFNAFGLYLSCFIPLLFSLTFHRGILGRTIVSILGISLAVALLLTYSRGSILGSAVGLAVMIIFHYRNRPISLMLILIGLSGGALLLNLVLSSGRYQETLNMGSRTEVWEAAMKAIFRDPFNFLFGTGSGTHAYWTRFEAEGHYYTPHNSYIFFWLETGLVGLLSFLSIFGIAFWKAVKVYLSDKNSLSKAMAFMTIGLIPSLLVQFIFAAGLMGLSDKALTFILITLFAIVKQKELKKGRLEKLIEREALQAH